MAPWRFVFFFLLAGSLPSMATAQGVVTPPPLPRPEVTRGREWTQYDGLLGLSDGYIDQAVAGFGYSTQRGWTQTQGYGIRVFSFLFDSDNVQDNGVGFSFSLVQEVIPDPRRQSLEDLDGASSDAAGDPVPDLELVCDVCGSPVAYDDPACPVCGAVFEEWDDAQEPDDTPPDIGGPPRQVAAAVVAGLDFMVLSNGHRPHGTHLGFQAQIPVNRDLWVSPYVQALRMLGSGLPNHYQVGAAIHASPFPRRPDWDVSLGAGLAWIRTEPSERFGYVYFGLAFKL